MAHRETSVIVGDAFVANVTEHLDATDISTIEAFFYVNTRWVLADDAFPDCVDRVLVRGYVQRAAEGWYSVAPTFRWHRQHPGEPKPRPIEGWYEQDATCETFEEACSIARGIVDALLASPQWLRIVAADRESQTLGGIGDVLATVACQTEVLV